MLKSQNTKYYTYEQNFILSLLAELNSSNIVEIQWIPGHQGIAGNDLADMTAKNLVNLQNIMQTQLNYADSIAQLDKSLQDQWQAHWEQQIELTNRGRALKQIKETLGGWSWARNKIRAVETGLARLRIGHVSLKEHLFRFRIANDPYCDCGEVESIEHYILSCPVYRIQRDSLKASISDIDRNLTMDLKTLLGGNTNLCETKQFKIVDAMTKYLIKTKKLYSL